MQPPPLNPPPRQASPVWFAAVMGAIVVLAVWTVGFIIHGCKESAAEMDRQQVAEQKTQSQRELEPKKEEVPETPTEPKIESVFFQHDSSGGWITGKVKNVTNHSLSSLVLTFALYNASGEKLRTTDTSLETLGVGETWSFKAGVLDVEAATCKIEDFRYR